MLLEELPPLLPVVQIDLNLESAHRGGTALISIFTGLSASSALQAIFDSTRNASRTTQLSTEAIMAH
jgi:hypothetical protein